jgi:hypothetical protein
LDHEPLAHVERRILDDLVERPIVEDLDEFRIRDFQGRAVVREERIVVAL